MIQFNLMFISLPSSSTTEKLKNCLQANKDMIVDPCVSNHLTCVTLSTYSVVGFSWNVQKQIIHYY